MLVAKALNRTGSKLDVNLIEGLELWNVRSEETDVVLYATEKDNVPAIPCSIGVQLEFDFWSSSRLASGKQSGHHAVV
jgi:hypothetical protein